MSGTTKERVYIAGPMTGIANYNIAAFNEAEEKLLEEGYDVINPARLFKPLAKVIASEADVLEHFHEYPRGKYAVAMIEMELALLRTCDAIKLLDGWKESQGAQRELAEAIENGLRVM